MKLLWMFEMSSKHEPQTLLTRFRDLIYDPSLNYFETPCTIDKPHYHETHPTCPLTTHLIDLYWKKHEKVVRWKCEVKLHNNMLIKEIKKYEEMSGKTNKAIIKHNFMNEGTGRAVTFLIKQIHFALG